jgi:hypothetical protein
MGDGTGVVEYSVTKNDGTSLYVAPVPVFFGLVNPFGHLWRVVAGQVFDIGAEKSLAYVAPSLYAGFSWTDLTGLTFAAEMPRASGYIKKFSNNLLAGVPTETAATAATWYCDYFYTDPATYSGVRLRLVGGSAYRGTGAGAFCTASYGAATTDANVSSPLCYFTQNPLITE